MKVSVLLLAAALLSATGASAITPLAAPAAAGLSGPGSTPTASERVHTQALPGGGTVTYFEATGTRDQRHEQFAQLRHTFEDLLPTVVLVEGEDCGADATEAQTIAHRGATGYGLFLAQQYGVPTSALYSAAAEYEYLRTRIDAEQLKLYYLLRYVQSYRQRLDPPRAVGVKALRQLIANSYGFVPGTEHTIQTMAQFRAAYRRHCPGAGDWWNVPAASFDANAPAASVPYQFLRDINRARAEFGQQYRAGKLSAYARAGQRVLVVTSPGYTPAL